MTFSSVPPMDGDEVTMLNEFEYYQLPSSKYQPEKFVGIVVRKQADFVLMYIPDPRFNCGELCVLLRKHANVRSLAEFNEKFTLGEFYDISVVRVTEPTVFGPRSIELMCTTDEIQLTKSDWKFTYSRVILGGFVQVKVICDFTDDNLEDLRDISGDCCCVYTDFGKVLVEKAFIVEQSDLYETSVNWWVTFVKETKGCHWQLFETDNPEAISECYDQQQMQKSDNALSDDQHSETISVPSPTMGRRELDGAQSMDDEGEQQQNDYDNRLRFCGAPVPLDRTVLAFLLERAKATLLNDEQLSRELARTQTLLRASERECEQLRCEVQRFKLQLSS